LTFFQVGNVAWMRWASARRGRGIESIGWVHHFNSAAGTTISASGNICALVSFAIRPEMWSPWKWEITTGLHGLWIDAGSGHALCQNARLWATRLPAPGAAVDQDPTAARVDSNDGERNGHMRVRQADRLECGFGLLNVGPFDEAFIMPLFPHAVVERDNLDIADFVCNFEPTFGPRPPQ
jgi:hypothetical protein